MANHRKARRLIGASTMLAVVAISLAAVFDMTLKDFHLSGTQVLEVDTTVIQPSGDCIGCHGPYDVSNDPFSTWSGSLMALAGRDPLFYAQMTTANQDVSNVGYFCMRCHVPMSFVTGHAYQPDGSTLDAIDRDGVTCHFCHSMVDPIYKPGVSPTEDEGILAGLVDVPAYYGNAMFVLDPTGTRRGPRSDSFPPHELIESPFHRTGQFCGTCHDVGNVAVTLQTDGTYAYNALDTATPTEDLWHQFPLERTYTEWNLSDFANGGVDMGGLFGGAGGGIIESCQDCHMPKADGLACIYGPQRSDLARHDFAGAAAPILDLIAEHYQNDPTIDLNAIAAARAKSVSMLERAADIELEQQCGSLRVRVINQTGHKLPTGHIEGRRVWVNVRFLDSTGTLVYEYGHYDVAEAQLDVESTEVYEMHVGLSEQASQLTGYPPGETSHMALADIIVKDNRIPPRGFANQAFAVAGAPVVGTSYADGQYWDDSYFSIPDGGATAEVEVFYQNLPRHYIENLRDGNVTDDWGDTLYDLWVTTGKGTPIRMDDDGLTLNEFVRGDIDCDGVIGVFDLLKVLSWWGIRDVPADLNGDRTVNIADLLLILANWG